MHAANWTFIDPSIDPRRRAHLHLVSAVPLDVEKLARTCPNCGASMATHRCPRVRTCGYYESSADV